VLQHNNLLFAFFAGVQIKYNFYLFTEQQHIKPPNLISMQIARCVTVSCYMTTLYLSLFASDVSQVEEHA